MTGTCEQLLTTINEGIELHPADILLVHTRRNFWAWLIRTATHCYWNHAMMVYSVGDRNQGYDDILVIDAKTDGSIVSRKLTEYLSRPDKYDLAVKRLNSSVFGVNRQLLPLNMRNHICRTAMREIQIKLSRRMISYKNQLIRQFTVIWRFIRRKIHIAIKQPVLPWSTRPSRVKAFTCSGFVQWCYYMGVLKADRKNRKTEDKLQDVIFNPRIEENPTPFGLLTTTPADLANCDKLSWVWIAQNGVGTVGTLKRGTKKQT